MGKERFASHTARFASAPRTPCVYAAELICDKGTWLKVGVAGNALGRLMSLQSEVKRCYGATIRRIAIYSSPTVKAAYEAETRLIKAVEQIARPILGKREFFDGVSFESACGAASETVGAMTWADLPALDGRKRRKQPA
jgi:hypothetical protein